MVLNVQKNRRLGRDIASTILAMSSNALPDLTVTGTATGTPSFISSSEATLPLTVIISNLGNATGTRFKLSVDVIDSSGRFVKPFNVPGGDRWCPWRAGLARGATHSFRSTLYIGLPGGSSLHGQRITIIPRVDSCSGDEFMPDYCRVWESNEANNENRRSVTLP